MADRKPLLDWIRLALAIINFYYINEQGLNRARTPVNLILTRNTQRIKQEQVIS